MSMFELWKRAISLEISRHMAYKANFFIKIFAVMLMDIVGPLVILLIYNTTPGIPGWTFEQFILFQGTLTLIFGIGHVFFVMIPIQCIHHIRNGTFDMFLTKPYKPLTYLTLTSPRIDGIGEIIVGFGLIVWSFIKLQLGFGINFWFYIGFIILALMFEYSVHVLTAALSFLVVKSWALFDILWRLKMFGRYPTSIYSPALQMMLTFIFPIAIAAFYPVKVLLKGVQSMSMLWVIVPVLAFFAIVMLLWKKAMTNYTSAGG